MSNPQQITEAAQHWQKGQIIADNDIYYRRFIEITPEGYYKVQDFYQNTHHKLTDPFILLNYWACRLGLLVYTLEKNYFSLWLGGYLSFGAIRLADIDGTYSIYTEKGVKIASFHCKLGKREGNSKTWYENGALEQEAYFKNNQLDGFISYWKEDGTRSHQFSYLEGKQHGTNSFWNSNGQLTRQTNYKNGEADGIWLEWYENGCLKSESHYKSGQPVSHWKEWNENSELINEWLYESS